jgi:epoxyqueuosine reductase QueG
LNGLLITKKGAAGRLCSVITSLELDPTHRPYKDKNGYCLYYMQGSCGLCVGRCPPKAIHTNGSSPGAACAKYAQDVVVPSIAPLPYKGGCGKCVTALPCEISIPRGIVTET